MPYPPFGLGWDSSSHYASWFPSSVPKDDATLGRRYRAFRHALPKARVTEIYQDTEQAYRILSEKQDERFANLAFSYKIHADPELHTGLQDLGWQIGWDLKEACDAFDDPDIWYPGVDEGIPPVPDSLIEVVIPALQRELNRELRSPLSGGYDKLPAAPLAELPWRIQRAIVERRRWRYKQYGLDNSNRESGAWNLWEIPEDSEWAPPWLA